MAMVLDELVLALGIDDKNFSAGEQAVVAGLDRLTAVMENVAQAFDTGEKKSSEALDKTGKKADKTAKDMEASGKSGVVLFQYSRPGAGAGRRHVVAGRPQKLCYRVHQ